MHNRESLADTWKTALVVITGVLAFLVFVGGGFMFAPENYWGETGFNFWAGIGAAIAVSLPLLPWIGLFHIFSKKPAASGIH